MGIGPTPEFLESLEPLAPRALTRLARQLGQSAKISEDLFAGRHLWGVSCASIPTGNCCRCGDQNPRFITHVSIPFAVLTSLMSAAPIAT